MIAVPPSEAGAVKFTETLVELIGVTVPTVGAPGAPAITTWSAADVDEMLPAASVAVAVTLLVPAESEAVVHE